MEAGGVPTPAKADAAAIGLPPVHEQIEAGTDLVSRVIHNGQIDTGALLKIENEGVAQQSAVANYLAANFDENPRNLPVAAPSLLAPLVFIPPHPILPHNSP